MYSENHDPGHMVRDNITARGFKNLERKLLLPYLINTSPSLEFLETREEKPITHHSVECQFTKRNHVKWAVQRMNYPLVHNQ